MIERPDTISLHQLQEGIGISLEEAFPYKLWVTAEVHNLNANRNGHVYLELIEKDDNTNGIKAQAKGVIWRNVANKVLSKFLSSTGNHLSSGMQILILASVSYHPVYGLSLNVTDIDPTYTLGDMERQRLRCIEQLKKDGVWDMNRMLTTPLVPLRIAVISSATAAGYRDFMKELERYAFPFRISLFEAVMQGVDAEPSIVEALDRIACGAEQYDIVTIIRGGGSTTDLNCFNSYGIASHIAQFPIPVVTGIGHDRDTSVADMVAHLQLKTPTATANWIAERVMDFNSSLQNASRSLGEICSNLTSKAETELMSLQTAIHTCTISAVSTSYTHIAQLSSDLGSLSKTLISSNLADLSYIHSTIASTVKNIFTSSDQHLKYSLSLAQNFSPKRLLDIGYSIVRHGAKTIHSIDELNQGEEFTVELHDGEITAVVQTKTKAENNEPERTI